LAHISKTQSDSFVAEIESLKRYTLILVSKVLSFYLHYGLLLSLMFPRSSIIRVKWMRRVGNVALWGEKEKFTQDKLDKLKEKEKC